MFIFRSVWGSLLKNPLRGFLTLIGISLGVTTIILVFNLSFRLQAYFKNTILGTGCRMTIVNATREHTIWTYQYPSVFNTYGMLCLKRDCPELKYISPVIPVYWKWIKKGSDLYNTWGVTGVGPEYAGLVDLKIITGRFISLDDSLFQSRVVVISETAARFLFGGAGPAIGRTITVNHGCIKEVKTPGRGSYIDYTYQSETYTVIGCFASVPFWRRIGYTIRDFYIPYTIDNSQIYPMAFMAGTNIEDFQTIKSKVEISLRQIYGTDTKVSIWQGGLESIDNYVEFQRAITWILISLGIIGIIALLISSFGVFSIMMVGNLERGKEIGLRRAMGSTRSGILFHFLGEALTLSLLGSLIGVIIAAICNRYIIHELTPFLTGFNTAEKIVLPYIIDMRALGYALVSVLIAGVFFGLYPAVTAGRITPVESLRES